MLPLYAPVLPSTDRSKVGATSEMRKASVIVRHELPEIPADTR